MPPIRLVLPLLACVALAGCGSANVTCGPTYASGCQASASSQASGAPAVPYAQQAPTDSYSPQGTDSSSAGTDAQTTTQDPPPSPDPATTNLSSSTGPGTTDQTSTSPDTTQITGSTP